MKKLFIIFSFLMSSVAFAITDVSLARKCESKGIEKLQTSASAANCNIISGTFRVADLDNRFYNPSKYVWYALDVDCGQNQTESIQELVQYNSVNGKCL